MLNLKKFMPIILLVPQHFVLDSLRCEHIPTTRTEAKQTSPLSYFLPRLSSGTKATISFQLTLICVIPASLIVSVEHMKYLKANSKPSLSKL